MSRQRSLYGRTSPTAGSPRRGFTLLEVLLTLLLVSLVLAAVAMAVDFQLRVVERGRRHVEEAQLARVLLHQIADDLRGAVPDDPLGMKDLCAEVVFSNIESAEATAAAVIGGSTESGSTPDSGSSGASGGATYETSESRSEVQDSEESESSEDVESSEDWELDATGESSATGQSSVPRSKPGVYGGSDWLQVDVGRLPRLDQFESLYAATDGSTPADRLSDVKTVTYYVVPPENGTREAPTYGTEPTTGLVRRELDRAVSSWASDQGQLDTTSTDVAPIAPEVTAIAFRYSDGSEWVEEWDCGEAGALPVAVEITLTITPLSDANDQSAWGTSTSSTSLEEEETLTYTLIVQLQAAGASSGGSMGGDAESATSEEASEETGESMETSESGSSATAPSEEGPTR